MLLTFLAFLSALGAAPARAADGDWTEVLIDGLKDLQAERWNLALEQARIELGAGLITPDGLITRAREIMVEQWGTPGERARFADEQKEKELHGRIESWVGGTNLTIWKRLAHQPGTCWTRTWEEGGIIIKDLHGAVIVLHRDRLPLQVGATDGAEELYERSLVALRLQFLTDVQFCTPMPPPPAAAPLPRPWWSVDLGPSSSF